MELLELLKTRFSPESTNGTHWRLKVELIFWIFHVLSAIFHRNCVKGIWMLYVWLRTGVCQFRPNRVLIESCAHFDHCHRPNAHHRILWVCRFSPVQEWDSGERRHTSPSVLCSPCIWERRAFREHENNHETSNTASSLNSNFWGSWQVFVALDANVCQRVCRWEERCHWGWICGSFECTPPLRLNRFPCSRRCR